VLTVDDARREAKRCICAVFFSAARRLANISSSWPRITPYDVVEVKPSAAAISAILAAYIRPESVVAPLCIT